jgi:hypothetical protein
VNADVAVYAHVSAASAIYCCSGISSINAAAASAVYCRAAAVCAAKHGPYSCRPDVHGCLHVQHGVILNYCPAWTTSLEDHVLCQQML